MPVVFLGKGREMGYQGFLVDWWRAREKAYQVPIYDVVDLY